MKLESYLEQMDRKHARRKELLTAVYTALGELAEKLDLSVSDGLHENVGLHYWGSDNLKMLRAVRRIADGPVEDRKIFPGGINGATVNYHLKIAGIGCVLHTTVADYGPLLKPGATCRVESICEVVVCGEGV